MLVLIWDLLIFIVWLIPAIYVNTIEMLYESINNLDIHMQDVV